MPHEKWLKPGRLRTDRAANPAGFVVGGFGRRVTCAHDERNASVLKIGSRVGYVASFGQLVTRKGEPGSNE